MAWNNLVFNVKPLISFIKEVKRSPKMKRVFPNADKIGLLYYLKQCNSTMFKTGSGVLEQKAIWVSFGNNTEQRAETIPSTPQFQMHS